MGIVLNADKILLISELQRFPSPYKSLSRKEGNRADNFVGTGPQQVLCLGSYSRPSSWESSPGIRNSLSPPLSIQTLLAFICREVALTWQRSWAVFFRCCYCIAAESANVSLISFWHPARGNMQWAISSNIVSVGNSSYSEPATWSRQGTVWFSALTLWNRNWNIKSSSVLGCLCFPRGTSSDAADSLSWHFPRISL